MKFICLMGKTASGKTTIAYQLEKFGFKRSVSYTTRKPSLENGIPENEIGTYKFVSREVFDGLINTGVIIEWDEYNNQLYGTPRPFGAKNYVGEVSLDGYKELKRIYGNQVIGIYLQCEEEIQKVRLLYKDLNTDEINKRNQIDSDLSNQIKENPEIIVIDNNGTVEDVTLEILRAVKVGGR